MSFVKAFERFDWLASSDAAEKLRSIRLSNTRLAERLDVTIVRNKQCKYNSCSAARGKIRLVENRLYVPHGQSFNSVHGISIPIVCDKDRAETQRRMRI